ncbi:MAG: addiction module protein [Polyangiales bacterium]
MPTSSERIRDRTASPLHDERTQTTRSTWGHLEHESAHGIESAWDAEVGQRIAKMEAGEVASEPWQDVYQNLRLALTR